MAVRVVGGDGWFSGKFRVPAGVACLFCAVKALRLSGVVGTIEMEASLISNRALAV